MLFIIYWVSDILNSLEREYIENRKKNNYVCNNDSNYNINSNNSCQKEINLYYLIYLTFVDLLFGFLFAYTKIRIYCSKENKKKNVKKINNKYKLIYNDPSQTKNKNILIILISILDFIARSSDFFYYLLIYKETGQKQFNFLFAFDIFSRIFFSHFILKIKIYRHHRLSIYFCGLGFLIMIIIGIIIFQEDQWTYSFFNLIPLILFALEDNINKILLTDKLLLPHFLLFFRGVVNCIIVIIFTFILHLASVIDFGFFIDLFKKINFGGFVILILHILLFFIKVFCLFKIIYIFTPIHVGFCNALLYIFETINNRRKNDYLEIPKLICFIFNSISLLLITFGTLLFTEMIIINNWGLNENTKSGIIKKEKLDDMELTSGINENDEDNEDKEELLTQTSKEDE